MSTFVLVPGAFVGGWTWRDFANLMRSHGHEVYTPTLTGLGDREHLGTPETDLTTHIQDVVSLVEFEDLHDVVLAGHSYGGMVITGVADRVPERIRHLVYIDAEVPHDGESEGDAVGAEEWPQWLAIYREEGWRTFLSRGFYQSEEGLRRFQRFSGQPKRTFEEKLHLRTPTEQQPFGRLFIAASNSAAPESIRRVQNDPAWRFVEITGGHVLYRDAPDELARILESLA